jgi:hypothetical protein
MLREIGATLFTIGIIFLVMGMWKVGSNNMFMFQIISGPIFIYLGLQLLK